MGERERIAEVLVAASAVVRVQVPNVGTVSGGLRWESVEDLADALVASGIGVLPPHLAPDAGAEDASMPDAASDTAVSDGGAGDAAVVDGSTPDGG